RSQAPPLRSLLMISPLSVHPAVSSVCRAHLTLSSSHLCSCISAALYIVIVIRADVFCVASLRQSTEIMSAVEALTAKAAATVAKDGTVIVDDGDKKY